MLISAGTSIQVIVTDCYEHSRSNGCIIKLSHFYRVFWWFVHSVELCAPLCSAPQVRRDLPRFKSFSSRSVNISVGISNKIAVFWIESLYFSSNCQMCSNCDLNPNCDCDLPISAKCQLQHTWLARWCCDAVADAGCSGGFVRNAQPLMSYINRRSHVNDVSKSVCRLIDRFDGWGSNARRSSRHWWWPWKQKSGFK